MVELEFGFLQGQLEERKRRLEAVIASTPRNSGVADLLRDVDAALDRMAEGTYGLCLECNDSVETERLFADPLVQYCLDHLTRLQRAALQRDLDLASQVQRNLLPQKDLCVGGWETSYHFAPDRTGQRGLLRLDPVRWAASVPFGRRFRQGRGRFHVDGTASRLVPQLDGDVVAAGSNCHARQSILLRECAGGTVCDSGVWAGEAKRGSGNP
jgi:RNA polymerase-binding transcription factor DksA